MFNPPIKHLFEFRKTKATIVFYQSLPECQGTGNSQKFLQKFRVLLKLNLIAILALTIVSSIFFYWERNTGEKYIWQYSHNEKFTELNETGSSVKLACVMPRSALWPEYYHNFNNSKFSIPDCSYEKNLAKCDEKFILKALNNLTCCAHEVLRGRNDSEFSFSACENLEATTDLIDKAIVFVRCENYTNAFANFPLYKNVKAKLDFWKSVPHNERPYSVFIFGFDSISRAHAYRSIPKSLEQMYQLGFVDFNSYHSVEASTLSNFMGFLIGLPRHVVRKTCARNWEAPFDNCPFIWKDFDAKNYVTFFFEDGKQSFNWGGQSGFNSVPTDYYFHHLFLALRQIRRNQSKKLYRDCTSKETTTEFMFQTSIRFLRKFSDYPFFFMEWFNDPFHAEDPTTLASYDGHLENFLKLISSEPKLLRKSLIVLIGDHGSRWGHYDGRSMDSYIERASPPLFIRIPDQMAEEFPDIVHTLRINSKILTTPFDVHHTLRHILQFKTVDLYPGGFQPHLQDRASLLSLVPTNRTCASVNILHEHNGTCLCNLKAGESTFKIDEKLAFKLLKLATGNLNSKINSYRYGNFCEQWISHHSGIQYINLLHGTAAFQKILLVFVAEPEQALFEATVQINLGSEMKLEENYLFGKVTNLERANLYGNQSWCIPTVTDKDKDMKGFCVCKMESGQLSKN